MSSGISSSESSSSEGKIRGFGTAGFGHITDGRVYFLHYFYCRLDEATWKKAPFRQILFGHDLPGISNLELIQFCIYLVGHKMTWKITHSWWVGDFFSGDNSVVKSRRRTRVGTGLVGFNLITDCCIWFVALLKMEIRRCRGFSSLCFGDRFRFTIGVGSKLCWCSFMLPSIASDRTFFRARKQ